VRERSDEGVPVVVRDADSPVAAAFHAVAEQIAAWTGKFAEQRVFVSIGRKPTAAAR
jgi:MinD-like ATPase involved in chromosome partitioning or flagellar assembly